MKECQSEATGHSQQQPTLQQNVRDDENNMEQDHHQEAEGSSQRQQEHSLLRVITQLNQVGVMNLQRLLFSRAAATFARALRRTLGTAQNRTNTNSVTLGRLRVHFPASIVMNTPLEQQQSGQTRPALVGQQAANNDILLVSEVSGEGSSPWSSTFRIYNKAAIVSTYGQDLHRNVNGQGELEQQYHEGNDDLVLAFVSAALLYNAGLVQHLKGFAARATRDLQSINVPTMREELQTESYRKSLQLYQVGANMLQRFFPRHHVEQDHQHDPNQQEEQGLHQMFFRKSYLLYLALVNNMAHIHLHFSNRQAHNECCDVLRAVLAAVREEGPPNTHGRTEDANDNHGDQPFFVLNLIASQNFERHAAATA